MKIEGFPWCSWRFQKPEHRLSVCSVCSVVKQTRALPTQKNLRNPTVDNKPEQCPKTPHVVPRPRPPAFRPRPPAPCQSETLSPSRHRPRTTVASRCITVKQKSKVIQCNGVVVVPAPLAHIDRPEKHLRRPLQPHHLEQLPHVIHRPVVQDMFHQQLIAHGLALVPGRIPEQLTVSPDEVLCSLVAHGYIVAEKQEPRPFRVASRSRTARFKGSSAADAAGSRVQG